METMIEEMKRHTEDEAARVAAISANAFEYWREMSRAGLAMLGSGEADHYGLNAHHDALEARFGPQAEAVGRWHWDGGWHWLAGNHAHLGRPSTYRTDGRPQAVAEQGQDGPL